MPRFSIVTITKDNPDGFNKTKQSIESQTYSDFEWIIIDGDVEPDNGIYDAMNKGLDRATGDYVIFMNAGDVFADDNTLLEISKYNADFIYGDAIEGDFIKKAKHHTKIKNGMITHHQAMIYKRDVIGDLRYDDVYSFAADYKFTIEFIKQSHSIQYIDKPLCIFEIGGVSQQNARASRHQEIAIRRELNISAPLTPYRQWAAQMIKKYMPLVYLKLRMITQK